MPADKAMGKSTPQEREVARLEQVVERRRARVADAERKLAEAHRRLKPGTPIKSTRHGAAKRKRTTDA